jgi:ABC-2 type transport system ATP-binding protein
MSGPTTNNAITVYNVTKTYGNFTAVDDLSFEVRRGEIFSMLGPNGAGKTTSIRMILDILKPDSGAIEVLGAPISDKIKDRIGYLPEERGLYRNVPVIDVLTYLGQLKGLSRGDAQQRAAIMLNRIELSANIKSKVSELSKGMQQKVQIIATVLHEPELIIIDEPFAGLDPVNTQLIKDLLYEMNDKGTTIVMSTHMMHQVEEMADRMLMIDHGRQVLYGSVSEIRERFAENAVIVEGEGDWSALPGVALARPSDNGRAYVLTLSEGTHPDDVMEAAAIGSDYRVRRFELAVPSLNDIFLRVAGNNRPAAHNGTNGG